MPAKTPEEVDALFEKYLNAGDIDALVDLYEPDAVLVAAPGQPVTGHAAIRAALQGFIDMKADLKLNVTHTLAAGDTAATYNEWSGTIEVGGQKQEISGKAIEICRKQADGTWRFAIDDPNARG
jgi:uncharacterized protein (TIGR02246 family)